MSASIGTSRVERFERAQCSVAGLSVGDAFGEQFFVHPDIAMPMIAARALPSSPWYFTDDTLMALSVVATVRQYGRIHQDALAADFARRYDSQRGYGPAMHGALARLRQGESWQEVSSGLFGGQGSFGNGAAMRVAPLGAYYADDIDMVVEQAGLSAEVTHAHPEAIAGAVAVAVAAALAWKAQAAHYRPPHAEFLDAIVERVPHSKVREGIERARGMESVTSIDFPVSVLGNGVKITAQDTVPFALWCVAQAMDNYEAALWLTVSGLGDRDTTCAIVGGIVAMYTGVEGIPGNWLNDREPLPNWFLHED